MVSMDLVWNVQTSLTQLLTGRTTGIQICVGRLHLSRIIYSNCNFMQDQWVNKQHHYFPAEHLAKTEFVFSFQAHQELVEPNPKKRPLASKWFHNVTSVDDVGVYTTRAQKNNRAVQTFWTV